MYKDNKYRCIKDLFQHSGRIAFAKGNVYFLKNYGAENSFILDNQDGHEHQLNSTEFTNHFKID